MGSEIKYKYDSYDANKKLRKKWKLLEETPEDQLVFSVVEKLMPRLNENEKEQLIGQVRKDIQEGFNEMKKGNIDFEDNTLLELGAYKLEKALKQIAPTYLTKDDRGDTKLDFSNQAQFSGILDNVIKSYKENAISIEQETVNMSNAKLNAQKQAKIKLVKANKELDASLKKLHGQIPTTYIKPESFVKKLLEKALGSRKNGKGNTIGLD